MAEHWVEQAEWAFLFPERVKASSHSRRYGVRWSEKLENEGSEQQEEGQQEFVVNPFSLSGVKAVKRCETMCSSAQEGNVQERTARYHAQLKPHLSEYAARAAEV